jgi:hypothetical protein
MPSRTWTFLIMLLTSAPAAALCVYNNVNLDPMKIYFDCGGGQCSRTFKISKGNRVCTNSGGFVSLLKGIKTYCKDVAVEKEQWVMTSYIKDEASGEMAVKCTIKAWDEK